MIISISGLHGTGKSTIGKLIAKKLGIQYYSAGQAFRDMALEKNMTLEEFSKFVEENPEIDKDLDNKVIRFAQKGNVIIDSQLSGYLLTTIADFKIMLLCPIEIRVKRMAERDGTSYNEKLKETQIREKSELDRFKNLYNIDLSDQEEIKRLYNLIINTENHTVEEIINTILLALAKNKFIT